MVIKISLLWPRTNFNESEMATAEMKMLTSTQPIIFYEGSDKDDNDLDHEEGYDTDDDLSDDYESKGDASDNDNLIPNGSSHVCKYFLQGRCHFDSRC